MEKFDVIVVGGGPSGLAAAINTASEGFRTLLIDSKDRVGGQAGTSYLIENYPGFPEGISGKSLTSKFMQQATRFKVEVLRPVVVSGFKRESDLIEVTTNDDTYRRIQGRALVLAVGLSYRKLSVPGVAEYLGRGVYYGRLPDEEKKHVCIVGGANSAGQAALHLADRGVKVTLIVRGESLEEGMSQYLRQRIADSSISVCLQTEVSEVLGEEFVSHVHVKRNGTYSILDADALAIYIGASPKTYWLNGLVDQTPKGFIVTGQNGFETSVPGVFACGDVREGSIKRVATAVGEGSVVAQQVRQLLGSPN